MSECCYPQERMICHSQNVVFGLDFNKWKGDFSAMASERRKKSFSLVYAAGLSLAWRGSLGALCAIAHWAFVASLLQCGGPERLTVKVLLSCSTTVVLPSTSRHLAVSWQWLSSLCSLRGDMEFLRNFVHQPPADPAALFPVEQSFIVLVTSEKLLKSLPWVGKDS